MTSLKNQQIELSKLVIHPNNVRVDQDDNDSGIDALACNIEAFGLFQNLVVQPLDDGCFGVLGGGRRLKALQTLDADGRLDMAKTPCRVVPKTMPWQTAISLAENAMQARMLGSVSELSSLRLICHHLLVLCQHLPGRALSLLP